jgi:DNA-binding CsgD family transcriptional regulator
VLNVSRGALVGRAAELGRLTGLLDVAAASQPVVALVSGDAGVGKTRLVSELGTVARERGFTVLAGHCAELADSVPYLPLADALRDAASDEPEGGVVADALAARPVLATLLPDPGAGPPTDGDGPGLAQQQLFGAVLGMLAELAAARPVLLILEDLHWADRSTRDLVTFLSRVMHHGRIAVVVTYRTDDMHRRHPLRPVITELLRLPSVTSVSLGPLPPAAMAEHLIAISAEPLDAADLGQLIARAEGNAYYAEELAAAVSCDPSELPAGLADLLLARMEQLTPVAQQVLRAAAVTGRRVDDELVRRASGLPEEEYEGAVREAVAHQLLIPDGRAGYMFRHALLREAIYADLLPGERTRLHARLAALLRDDERLAGVPGAAAELAQHSLASHDIPGAFAASIKAAEEAERLAAPAEAHRHYDQALSLWDRVSGPEELAGKGRGQLALHSAVSAADSGEVVRAVQQLRQLRDYLDPAAEARLYSRVSERLAYFLLDIDEDNEAVEAAATSAAALAGGPPSWEYARALATHARTLLAGPDPDLAQPRAEEAAAAAVAAGAPWIEADALVTLGSLSERAGRQDEAIEKLTEAYRQATRAGVLGVQLRAAFQLARLRLEWGELSAASQTAHDGQRLAADEGLSLAPYGLDLHYLHYLAHFAGGDWDQAQELADGFAVRVTSIAEARLSAMALYIEVARGTSGVAERRSWLEPFLARDRFAEYIARGLLAEHALWQGDLDTAIAQTEATIKAVEAWGEGYGPPVIRAAAIGISALADRAAYGRTIGDEVRVSAAVRAGAELINIARQGVSYPRSPHAALGADGRGWLARAEAEWRRAQGDNDPAAWTSVVDTFGPAYVYEYARSRWRLAEALVEAGRRAEAEEHWHDALTAARRLGAVPLRTALEDLGRRARLREGGAHAAGPGRDGPGGSGGAHRGPLAGLTEREREVLRLLATGQTNKEIGAELFIAPKTASVHVSNILAKLGAGSRTEAAAIAHAEGLDRA